MLILRLFIVLVSLLLILSCGMYLFTRNPRYLKFIGKLVRFVIIVLLVFGLLFILERYVLIGWRVFL